MSFHVILFQPEIPPNAGNVIRLAANSGAKLHLVRPLGFNLDDRSLRRAGLDYDELATLQVHDNWLACRRALATTRLFALTTKGTTRYDCPAFAAGDAFLFGAETRGLPAEVLAEILPENRLRLPMVAGNRSLNLANTVSIVVYEAWRQIAFAGS